LFPGGLSRPPDGLGSLAVLSLGRFFVGLAPLHLTEHTLALHLLLENLEGLIDIVVANEDLQMLSNPVVAAVVTQPSSCCCRRVWSASDFEARTIEPGDNNDLSVQLRLVTFDSKVRIHCAAPSFASFGIEGHQQLIDLAARMMRTSEPPH
jgi:hypothetical protein